MTIPCLALIVSIIALLLAGYAVILYERDLLPLQDDITELMFWNEDLEKRLKKMEEDLNDVTKRGGYDG